MEKEKVLKQAKPINQPKDKPVMVRCPFPDCPMIMERKEGQPAFCQKHFALTRDVLFILNHTMQAPPGMNPKTAATAMKTGLVLPGQKEFAMAPQGDRK